jgi:arsenate reductase
MTEKSILILCTGNSCRSQMAEAIVNHDLVGQWKASSAGIQPAGFVHPLALRVLEEIGIHHAGVSKSTEQFRNVPFDLIITVCDDAAEHCPVWLGPGKKVHIGFPDPAKAIGSEAEILNAFRRVRDDIRQQIVLYLQQEIEQVSKILIREVQVDQKERVLFLCTGNSARSQMAEAFLRKYGGEYYEVFSAGLEPKGINPLIIQVMEEKGYDLSGQTSKGVDVFLGKMLIQTLITVCDHAEKNCPRTWPGVNQKLHWSFEDPAAFEGSEPEKLAKFREIRDQIEQKVMDWLRERGQAPHSFEIQEHY